MHLRAETKRGDIHVPPNRDLHEGTLIVTALLHRRDCGPAGQRAPPRAARVMGGGPPGSAGVPPACYAVRCRSVSLRCDARPPSWRERHGPGPSRAPASLPETTTKGTKTPFVTICAFCGEPTLLTKSHRILKETPHRCGRTGPGLFETNAATQAATACGTSSRPRDLAASARPARRRVPPSVARVMGGGVTRERGRPARMHSRSVPLSFPAMRHPATLPAGMAWARPRQRPDEVAGRAGWRRWARPCQCGAGGTPALPGGHPLAAHRLLVLFIGPKRSVVSLSYDPPEGAWAALA